MNRKFAAILLCISMLFTMNGVVVAAESLFFARPFCRKLQNKNVGCCKTVL